MIRPLLAVVLVGCLLLGPSASRPGAALAIGQEGRWSVASLPEPRGVRMTTVVGDVALFVGGGSLGPPSNVVDIYDHAARQWTTAALSVGRTGPSATTVGTRVVIAGGWDSTSAASRVVDVYDAATGGWSVSSLAHPWPGGEVVTVGNKVLLAGSETVDVFDAPTGQVSTATLAQPRSGFLTAVVGTRALLVGGTAGEAPSATVDVYDSAADSWSSATLSQARSGMKVAVVGDRVLFAGGDVDKQPVDLVDVYDGTTGAWTTARLSAARDAFAVAVVGGVALFAGGYLPTGRSPSTELAVVDLYDSTTGTWSTAMLSETRRVAAAVAGPRALFASASVCRPDNCARTVDVFDSRTGAWSTTELHAPRIFWPGLIDRGGDVGGIMIGAGNRVVFAGGAGVSTFGGGGQYSWAFPTTSAQVYDAESGQWSEETLAGVVYTPLVRASGTLVALTGRNDEHVQLGMSTPPAPDSVYGTVDLVSSTTGEWIRGTLSEPRRDLGLAVVGDKAIFAGGTIRNREDSTSTRVDIYDGATGEWSATSFPGAKTDVPNLESVTVGTQAVFYGRYGGSAVNVFDVATRQWTAGTLSPTRWSLGVAAVGDHVIFAGGKLSSPDDTSSAAVDIYDSRTGTWSTANLSEPREEPGIAVVGTTAIIAGGVVRGRPARDSEVVDLYDTATGTWSTTAMPTVRGAPARTATVGTQAIFLQPGKGDVYDTATGQWTTMESVPSWINKYSAKVSTVGTAVVAADRSEVAVYESTTGQWTTASLSDSRNDAAIAVVGTEVIFALGHTPTPYRYLPTADIYDVRTGAWRTAALSEPRYYAGVTVVGSRAIFAGGKSENQPSDSVDVYDAATQTWTTAHLSVPRASVAAATVRSRAVLAGGSAESQGRARYSDRVDILDLGADQGG